MKLIKLLLMNALLIALVGALGACSSSKKKVDSEESIESIEGEDVSFESEDDDLLGDDELSTDIVDSPIEDNSYDDGDLQVEEATESETLNQIAQSDALEVEDSSIDYTSDTSDSLSLGSGSSGLGR